MSPTAHACDLTEAHPRRSSTIGNGRGLVGPHLDGLLSTSRSRAAASSTSARDLSAHQSSECIHALLELFQPVRHAHLAVHRRRGSQVLLGLTGITRPAVE